MIKVQHIIKGTTLLAVCGFMIIVWAQGRPELPPAQSGKDSIRAVKYCLRHDQLYLDGAINRERLKARSHVALCRLV